VTFGQVARPRVSWILPFLNEQRELPVALARLESILDLAGVGEFEVILLDSGSQDGSCGIVRDWVSAQQESRGPSHSKLSWVETQVTSLPEGPSLGRALEVLRARGEVSGDWVVILPVDCHLSADAVREFLEWGRSKRSGEDGQSVVGVYFPKEYTPNTRVLSAYAWVQNKVRLRALKLAVWTNAITVHSDAWEQVPPPRVGFLEDVIWVDQLLARFGRGAIHVMRSPLLVSSRRYYPARVLRRIWINGLIMLLFRLRLRTPAQLKLLYRSLG